MRKVFALVLGSIGILAAATPASAGYNYVKCRTVNGTIIVVEGPYCPAGTVYVGPA